MTNQRQFITRAILSTFAALLIVIGVAGVSDLGKRPWSGLATDDYGRVTTVAPNSPALAAGFQIGDSVMVSAGVRTDDFASRLRLPRAAVGEKQAYTIKRGDQTIALDLTFAKLPAKNRALALSLSALGVMFVSVGLWTLFKITYLRTMLLTLICLSAAIDLITHPYISSYEWRLVYMAVLNILVLSGYAFLYHFVITLEQNSSVLMGGTRAMRIYGPFVVLTVILLVVTIVRPDRSSWLFALAGIVYTLFFVAYLALIFGTLIYRYVKTTAAERAARGLNIILLGLVIGLVPSVVAGVVGYVAPTIKLPGSEYYILAAIAIPIALAHAATRPRLVLEATR